MNQANVPSKGGHYSTWKQAGNLVFVSGQVPRDSERRLLGSSIEEQTAATLDNLEKVLRLAGSSLTNLVKVNVYLTSMSDFQGFNRAYAQRMGDASPARTTVGCNLNGVLVEVDGIAVVESPNPTGG
ncbi:hypothetical protein UB46_38355 [Burkholderiaceae bacterium 16]|nr:hypothetical protein UB46_38355 [Burkholderiaceae bacterium 16]